MKMQRLARPRASRTPIHFEHPFERIEMTVTLRQARMLCTTAEFEIVLASGGEGLKGLSEARLKQKVVRARALRDKYRDLLWRQRLAARVAGAKLARHDADARTAAKASLFAEVLVRFSARLAQIRGKSPAARQKAKAAAKGIKGGTRDGTKGAKAAVGDAAGKAATKVVVKPAKKVAIAAPAAALGPARSPKAPVSPTLLVDSVRQPAARGFMSDKAAQLARNVKLRSMQARAVQAHVSSRGRRNQAKRDSRPR